MMGIAAFGTAVGAFSKGYSEGEKQRSDMEDAELRRQATRLGMRRTEQEIELGGLQLDEAKDRQKAVKAGRAIIDQWRPFLNGETDVPPAASNDQSTPTAPARKAGITAPTDAVGESSVATAPAAGISTPGAAPAASVAPGATGGTAAPMNRWDGLQKMINQITMANLTADPSKAGEHLKIALDMSKRFTDQKTSDAIQALQSFNGQNGDQVLAQLGQAGLQMPQGTKFEKRRVEAFPNSGIFVDDTVAVSPDRKNTVSVTELMKQRLDPKEWLHMNNDLGYKAADLAQKREAEQNLNNYRQRIATVNENQLAETIRHNQATERTQALQREAYLEQIKDLKGAQALREQMVATDRARSTIFSNLGINPNMPADKLDMLSGTEKTAFKNGLLTGETAYTIWRMNLSPDNKEGISTADALQITRNASKIKVEDIKRDDSGTYIEYGKKKVYIPGMFADQPAPAPTAGDKPGVKTPPPSRKLDEDGLPIPTASPELAQGYRTPDARGLLRTPSYSAGADTFNPQ